MQKSQAAILAAKDLTDRVQDMVETLGKMVNEELPALSETMRDIIGSDEAQTYSQSATDTLNSLLETVRGSKEAMDTAAQVLAGEKPAEPADAGADTDVLGSGTDMGDDTGISPEEAGEELLKAPAASKGGKSSMGRGKR